MTGGVDNTARIFNAQSGRNISTLFRISTNRLGQLVRQIAEHSHYVQGVAWDPLNEFVATQSSDRSVHIYALKLKDGTCTLSAHGKFHKMDMPARRISSSSPAPPEVTARPPSGGANLAIASPAPSTPGTPAATAMPMDPPALTSHSRRSSFGSSPSFRRSASPAPSLPLPAVRPMEVNSPVLGAAMGLGVRNANIYHNETLTSFFRRLTFAPDGSLLFTPSGQYKQSLQTGGEPTKQSEDVLNTVYIYTRAGFNKPPVTHLPGHKKPSIAVKCSPVFYTLRQGHRPTNHITIDTNSSEDQIPPLPDPVVSMPGSSSNSVMDPPPPAHSNSWVTSDPTHATQSPKPEIESTSVFALPYRIVYAVATQDAVLVYDTQQQAPLCVVSNLHYATFSDLTWYVFPSLSCFCQMRLIGHLRSPDGLTLLMSSTDGFCSALSFTAGELGQPYTGEVPTHHHRRNRSESHVTNISTTASSSASNTPLPTPTTTSQSPSLHKSNLAPPATQSPVPAPPPAHFVHRPTSPTRSNSASSVATLSSAQAPTPAGSGIQTNPTPTMGHVPLVTATHSAQPGQACLPVQTPPMTPMSGNHGHSASNSTSGSVLGKRDGASESEREEKPKEGVKRRRVQPTLVSNDNESGNGTASGEAGA